MICNGLFVTNVTRKGVCIVAQIRINIGTEWRLVVGDFSWMGVFLSYCYLQKRMHPVPPSIQEGQVEAAAAVQSQRGQACQIPQTLYLRYYLRTALSST